MSKNSVIFSMFVWLFSIFSSNAKDNNFEFGPPLDIPMYLSGNFGEIRSNHFHTGIDIKTQGAEGKNVLAIADGFVSRVKVQAGGYGNALYITHNNGYTSVYAHLKSFKSDISKYVEDHQYAQKTFEIDLYLVKDLYKVKKGEVIAFSGNSGGSSGPHLHFEIRDQDQKPLNILRYPIDIKDDIAPDYKTLVIYPLNGGQVNYQENKLLLGLYYQNGIYKPKQKVYVNGTFGLGVEIFDYLNGAQNRCGLYALDVEFDNELLSQFTMEQLNFNYQRYINSHIDYAERMRSGKKVARLYKLPNNQLHLYQYANGDGLIHIADTLLHTIKLIAKDAFNNQSVLEMKVKGVGHRDIVMQETKGNGFEMKYNQPNSYVLNDFKLQIPNGALYNDIHFQYLKTNVETKNIQLSELHHVHNIYEPLHKYATLSIKPDSIIKGAIDKMAIYRLEYNGDVEFEGGKYINGYVTTNIRNFGKYFILLDTIAPIIRPINIRQNANLTGYRAVKLIIQDKMSEIDQYNGYIDDKWVLFKYDKKNSLIEYEFNGDKIEKGQWHNLKLEITDKVGNMAKSTFRFYY